MPSISIVNIFTGQTITQADNPENDQDEQSKIPSIGNMKMIRLRRSQINQDRIKKDFPWLDSEDVYQNLKTKQ